MNDFKLPRFPATQMPDLSWWRTLWPDPGTVLRGVGIEAGMQVVDLCCGDGYFTEPLCQLAFPGKIWALDLDLELLHRAQERCRYFSNFYAVQGDAREVSALISEPLDFIFMANTFHGVPDKTELSQVVHQALESGGRFAIVNWYRRPREETTVLDRPRGPSTELRMEPEDVRQVVEPGGFKLEQVVAVGPYHYGAVFLKI